MDTKKCQVSTEAGVTSSTRGSLEVFTEEVICRSLSHSFKGHLTSCEQAWW